MSLRSLRLRAGLRPPVSRPTIPPSSALRTRFLSQTHFRPAPASRSSFFAIYPRIAIPRYALWLMPLAGGAALFAASWNTQTSLATLLTSPELIPCIAPAPEPILILSPAEPQHSIPARIALTLRDWIWEPLLTARRFIFLAFVFAPVILTSPMLLVGTPSRELSGERWGAVWWYDFLVTQMARAGPTFIKLAQWAGSRTDLFPPLLCERLGSLHSNGKPHPFSHTRRVVERVFGKDFGEVFEEFDHDPIGVGAVAQVYRATLKKDLLPPEYLDPKRPRKSKVTKITPPALLGPPPAVPTAAVAVKIKHPKVEKLIARDLAIMGFFARFVTIFPGMEWLSLPEEVDIFGEMMNEQLNLRREAENLETFEKNFKHRKEPVTFPRPLTTFSAHDVLVEEFQRALPLEIFLRNGGGPFDDQLAQLGLDAFLNMLLLDNFVHADLHPGNIMVKFVKPSTRLLLRNVFASLWKGQEGTIVEPYSSTESDIIVNRLLPLVNDPPAWRKELEQLATDGYAPEVVFIDAGLVTTLDAKNRANFLDLFKAIAEFDGYRAGQLMVERCRAPQLARDPETFALKIQHLVLDVKRSTFSLGAVRVADVLGKVLKAVRDHHVKMEGDFVNTVLSILLLEGIGRQLDPGLDLFASALPILRQLGRQLTEEATFTGQMPAPKDIGTMLKIWVYMEARGLANAAFVNIDDLVRYDRLMPNV